MKLQEYDGKCVRIVDSDGAVFEGICGYYNKAYNKHEYGRNEESLKIVNFQFYRKDIRDIESLEEHQGPFGRFSSAYGLIEEMNVRDGIDSIEEVLFSEEEEHIYRMLSCLEKYLDPCHEDEFSCRSEVLKSLRELLMMNVNEDIRKKAGQLLEKWG